VEHYNITLVKQKKNVSVYCLNKGTFFLH